MSVYLMRVCPCIVAYA